MSIPDSKKLRKYITQLLKEHMLLEAAGSMGLAAVLARALADKILDDVDRIGFVYIVQKHNAQSRCNIPLLDVVEDLVKKDQVIALKVRPKKKEYSVIATSFSKRMLPNELGADNAIFVQSIRNHAYQDYPGDAIVLGNAYFNDVKIPGSGAHGLRKEDLDKFEAIGNDFLSKYVKSAENEKKILEVFESVGAVGYFAAAFMVFITQAESDGSRGHVSSLSATSMGGKLVIGTNAMTVTAETTGIWNMGMSFFSNDQIEHIKKSMDLPIGLNVPITVSPKQSFNNLSKQMVAFDEKFRRIIASNTTYIHELQHLIQHAGYHTPSSQLDPGADVDITSPTHPLHPYNGDPPNTAAREAGLAKSKRPPAQHIKIVSQMLKELNIIKGEEIKISGINSPAFELDDAAFSSTTIGLSTSIFVKENVYLEVNVADHLSDVVLKHMSDTYLSALPSKNMFPEEREAQIKRYGSAAGKKSVARKYRLFLADILADIGIYTYQKYIFDRTDQIKADMGIGPRDKTIPDALKVASERFPDRTEKAIERLNKSLLNKGGKLSKDLIEKMRPVFPTMVFYSRKLGVFIGKGKYGPPGWIKQHLYIEFLENYDIDEDLLNELKKGSEDRYYLSKNQKDLGLRLLKELDLVLVIAQSGADTAFMGEDERLEAEAGRSGRVSRGYAYSGSQWYQRANGYTWRRLQTEYDAEFVTQTAGFLYGIYILGTEDDATANRILAPTYLMDYFRRSPKIQPMIEFLFALLGEDITKVISGIKNFSKKSRHNFQGFIDRDLAKQKSDQYRRLAIDMIDKIQNISDEELNDLRIDIANNSVEMIYGSRTKKATPKQINDLTPVINEFLASGGSVDRLTHLHVETVKAIIGFVGKKLLE